MALQCQPDRLCLTMKTWAGASPGLLLLGTVFSKVNTHRDKCTVYNYCLKGIPLHHCSFIICVTNVKSCSCLSSGTHLHFHSGSNVEWQNVEDLDSAEEYSGDEERSRSLKVHNRSSLSDHLVGSEIQMNLSAMFILSSGLTESEQAPIIFKWTK